MFSIYCKSRVKSWMNRKNSDRITSIKPFINRYKWKEINFPSEKDDWEKCEKINVAIACNVLYLKDWICCLCFNP